MLTGPLWYRLHGIGLPTTPIGGAAASFLGLSLALSTAVWLGLIVFGLESTIILLDTAFWPPASRKDNSFLMPTSIGCAGAFTTCFGRLRLDLVVGLVISAILTEKFLLFNHKIVFTLLSWLTFSGNGDRPVIFAVDAVA